MPKVLDGIERIESLKYDLSLHPFLNQIAKERELETGEYSAGSITFRVMQKYQIRSWLKPVLANFLDIGVVDASLAEDPVRICKDNAYADTHLVLAHDLTLPILKRYLDDNWTSNIRPRMHPFKTERHTVEAFPKLRQDIYNEYLNKRASGMTIRAIAYKYNVSESTVKRIITVKKKS